MMQSNANILAVAGSVCLVNALALAWCLVAVRSSAFVKRILPGYQNVLKAHLDYLMMTGLLMIFFLLFTHFRVSPSPFVLAGMCAGSLMNPIGFIVLAINPTIRQQPASPFGVVMATSFTMTTIGYAGGAWAISRAALSVL